MRPIDADALGDKVADLYSEGEEATEGDKVVNDVIDLIDNAPTVDIKPFASFSFDKDELNRIVEERVIEPIKNGELVVKTEGRPQGEWLTHRVAFHLTCPFCGCNLRALKDKVFEGDYEYNFCPNCGAKLTKEAENDV